MGSARKFILIILLVSKIAAGQKEIALTVGNAYKTGHGTLYFPIGYRPTKVFEIYLAPAWGMFSGGIGVFYGAKLNILSKYRFYTNLDFAYRHSHRTVVSYENHLSGGQESYKIPSADFLVMGFGLNYKIHDQQNQQGVVSFTFTYSYALGNFNYGYLKGPFSPSGEDGARRRLISGLGATLSVTGLFTK